MIGDTPTIISRAFRKAEKFGMGLCFEGRGVYDIFVVDNAARWFANEAVSDVQMMAVGMEAMNGHCSLPTEIFLVALFGIDLPEEVALAYFEDRFNELGPTVAKAIKARGVDWEERWLQFTVASTPEPIK